MTPDAATLPEPAPSRSLHWDMLYDGLLELRAGLERERERLREGARAIRAARAAPGRTEPVRQRQDGYSRDWRGVGPSTLAAVVGALWRKVYAPLDRSHPVIYRSYVEGKPEPEGDGQAHGSQWLTVSDLAFYAGCSRRQVRRVLAFLEGIDVGLGKGVRLVRRLYRRWAPSLYEISMAAWERLAKLARTKVVDAYYADKRRARLELVEEAARAAMLPSTPPGPADARQGEAAGVTPGGPTPEPPLRPRTAAELALEVFGPELAREYGLDDQRLRRLWIGVGKPDAAAWRSQCAAIAGALGEGVELSALHPRAGTAWLSNPAWWPARVRGAGGALPAAQAPEPAKPASYPTPMALEQGAPWVPPFAKGEIDGGTDAQALWGRVRGRVRESMLGWAASALESARPRLQGGYLLLELDHLGTATILGSDEHAYAELVDLVGGPVAFQVPKARPPPGS